MKTKPKLRARRMRGNYDDDPQTWQRKSANGVPQLEAHLNVF